MKHFRYQSHLMHMFFFFNRDHFPKHQRLGKTPTEIGVSFINQNENQGMFQLLNQIRSRLFVLLFGTQFPMISKELKNKLQLSPQKKLGDWFLFEDHTIIRVYGFEDEPFLLPSFLTPRIYASKYISQIFSLDHEHF